MQFSYERKSLMHCSTLDIVLLPERSCYFDNFRISGKCAIKTLYYYIAK